MSLAYFRSSLERAKGQKDYINRKIVETEDFIKYSQKRLISIEEAQVFIQDIAQQTQNQLRFHIKDIVQLCLDTFWEGEIEFDLEFEVKRGKTECSLKFLIDGEEVSPIDAEGGGLVDIASFGLRIAVWSLGNTRNTIVLDEPFRFLSVEHQGKASEMLKELSEKLNIQFIIVTHNEEITAVADKIFKVSRKRKGDYYESEVIVL